MSKVLMVDDVKLDRDYLNTILTDQGFQVRPLASADSIVEAVREFSPDIVLLDYKLPNVDGLEAIRQIRNDAKFNFMPPIIMVSGVDTEAEKVKALESGADDYVVKPILPKELAARIHAVLRRANFSKHDEAEVIRVGELVLDLGAHRVTISGESIYLTLTEFRILSELLRQNGQVLSRDALREKALGNFNVTDRTIDVHMASLRKKLVNYGHSIETVRGVGYRFAKVAN